VRRKGWTARIPFFFLTVSSKHDRINSLTTKRKAPYYEGIINSQNAWRSH
jgi:predicted secreted hydrolase